MASIFEAPSEPRRSRLPSGLPQIAAAFAAGVVVAIAVARPGTPPDNAPIAERAVPTATAPPRNLTKPDQTVVAQPLPTTESMAPAPKTYAEAPAAEVSKEVTSCTRGQWPYFDSGCSEPDTNRGEKQQSIRVIGVDQTAPLSVVANPRPQAEPAAPQIAAAAIEPSATATTAAPDRAAVAGQDSSMQAGHTMGAPSAAVAPAAQRAEQVAHPTLEQIPMPEPAPRMKVKAEPVPLAKPRATVQRDLKKPDDTKSSDQVRKAEKVRTSKLDRDHEAPAPRRRDSIKGQNEAEGFSLVRSHVLPDGRRVTVYRKYENEGSRERRSSMRSLFGSPFDDDEFD